MPRPGVLDPSQPAVRRTPHLYRSWGQGTSRREVRGEARGESRYPQTVDAWIPAGLRFPASHRSETRSVETEPLPRSPAVPEAQQRGQWAMRATLRPAALSACPPCTVSVKLQQLAGHRNLIIQPCPFPTHPLPGARGSFCSGKNRSKGSPTRNGRGMEEIHKDFVAPGLCRLLLFPCPPLCPLQEAAVSVP